LRHLIPIYELYSRASTFSQHSFRCPPMLLSFVRLDAPLSNLGAFLPPLCIGFFLAVPPSDGISVCSHEPTNGLHGRYAFLPYTLSSLPSDFCPSTPFFFLFYIRRPHCFEGGVSCSRRATFKCAVVSPLPRFWFEASALWIVFLFSIFCYGPLPGLFVAVSPPFSTVDIPIPLLFAHWFPGCLFCSFFLSPKSDSTRHPSPGLFYLSPVYVSNPGFFFGGPRKSSQFLFSIDQQVLISSLFPPSFCQTS